MKEKITIVIKENKIEKSQALQQNRVDLREKKALKKTIFETFHNIKFQLSENGSAISKLGIAVRRYRFGLAISGLVFMLIFKNDNTSAIGYNNADFEKTSMTAGTEEILSSETKEKKNTQKLTKKSETKKIAKNKNLEKGEALKSYHVPNIPNISKRSKKAFTDIGIDTEKALNIYLEKYSKIAQEESKKFGIPASITLGLAILNSEYGYSKLAENANNHFGIMCSENTIAMGRGMKSQVVKQDICYTVYETAWSSFRANSKMIEKIYKKNSPKGDKNQFSIINSLEKANYFNHRGFSANDLIKIIEDHNLNSFDQI
jgi:flagellum-specific peptidoglycan hydrolase FlgJ